MAFSRPVFVELGFRRVVTRRAVSAAIRLRPRRAQANSPLADGTRQQRRRIAASGRTSFYRGSVGANLICI
jgi:hypothetical protein